MLAFEIIAEQRIREAMERGEFDQLPGAGRPLALDDDATVPAELRMAYKILKNAGCVPPEVELTNEIASLRRLVLEMDEGEQKKSHVRELNFKLMKLEMMRKRPVSLTVLTQYEEKILDKMDR